MISISAVTINNTGTQILIQFSESSVAGVVASDYALSGSMGAGIILSNAQPSGNDWTIDIDPRTPVLIGESVTLDYTPGTTTSSGDGGDLEAIAGVNTTNNSSALPPTPAQFDVSGATAAGTTVSWAAQVRINGFFLFRGLLADHSDAAFITPLDSVVTSYQDTTTTKGTRYYYRLQADSPAGQSDFADANQVAQGPLGIATPGGGGLVGHIQHLPHVGHVFGR